MEALVLKEKVPLQATTVPKDLKETNAKLIWISADQTLASIEVLVWKAMEL